MQQRTEQWRNVKNSDNSPQKHHKSHCIAMQHHFQAVSQNSSDNADASDEGNDTSSVLSAVALPSDSAPEVPKSSLRVQLQPACDSRNKNRDQKQGAGAGKAESNDSM
eukprot:CAMPEP_0183343542 /NCGR_PEP_ID=MMETSP0164_2-20130417/9432_1 /TAXON_ID=221442 /ORGANISM="Coccolithus pelagicus ssp braarudi, Strain PLY182g" /LENGTH=107 /DNA_ID=CAMNT_0025514381 /DNA_START=48 /DNA_END=371 /DNA_ORIENTATION=-